MDLRTDLPWASRQVRRPRAGVGGSAGTPEGTAWAKRCSAGMVGLVAATLFARIRVDLRTDLPWASREVRRPRAGKDKRDGLGKKRLDRDGWLGGRHTLGEKFDFLRFGDR